MLVARSAGAGGFSCLAALLGIALAGGPERLLRAEEGGGGGLAPAVGPKLEGGQAQEHAEPPKADPGKAAIPEEAKLKAAEGMIRELFKKEFADRTPEGLAALFSRLLDQAGKAADDQAAQYVLLREARNAAIAAGDPRQALKAVDEWAKRFEVPTFDLKAESLEKISSKAQSPEALGAVAEGYVGLIEGALEANEFSLVNKLLPQAQRLAQGSKLASLMGRLKVLGDEAHELQAEFLRVKGSLAVLEKTPDDPKACAEYGRFLCFEKGDWAPGLALLAKGNDTVLKNLAQKDAMNPVEAKDQEAVADGWMGLAAAEKRLKRKEALLQRADYWFQEALKKVDGLNKVRLEKKQTELRLQVGPRQAFLDQLTPLACTVGYGVPGKNGDLGYEDKKVTVRGQTRVQNSLSLHPKEKGESLVRYALQKRYRILQGVAAINDTAKKIATPLTFKILGDGRELWSSAEMQMAGKSQPFKVDVTGVEVLELKVLCPGSNANAQSVWINPQISK